MLYSFLAPAMFTILFETHCMYCIHSAPVFMFALVFACFFITFSILFIDDCDTLHVYTALVIFYCFIYI
uniref:ATPase subunit 6 n=1 Tax=Aster yellows phytoplasma TaxID=35779 RepID=Q849B5_ASTYP|nr:ATPase subunit 6 [Aster yellows phytoplasma]